MPRKINDSCMFCEPEAPCEAHKPKEKKKAASRGTSKTKSPSVSTVQTMLPAPVESPAKSPSQLMDLKAAMKAAAVETAPTQNDTPSSLPKMRRTKTETGTMSLITLDPIQTSSVRSQTASPVHLDARASMKESARLIEEQTNSDHDEILACVAVLEPILHPEAIKPYRGALWRRRNL